MLQRTLAGLATVVAVASTSALAQAGPVAQVSPDQLVCQLSGDCGKDAATATLDKPESRGFSIARHAPVASAAPQSTPGKLVSSSARAGAAGQRRVAMRPSGPVGRANLSINFVLGSADLTDSGKAQAQAVVQALRAPQLAGGRFMIGGHTDAIGSRDFNLDLSKRRAQAVVDYLVAQGADRSQFEVKGFGFDDPLPGTAPRAATNRRVEVVKLN